MEGKQLPLEETTQICLPNLWSLFHGDNLVQQPNLAAREAGAQSLLPDRRGSC